MGHMGKHGLFQGLKKIRITVGRISYKISVVELYFDRENCLKTVDVLEV